MEHELSPLKRAYLAIEQLQAKNEALERGHTGPIAIIGIGCRFPGGADSSEAFWQLLDRGVDAVGSAPLDRSTAASLAALPDHIAVPTHGGFLRDIDRFDPEFFGISPREAVSLDPQHRLLLEVSWEALERAGQIQHRLAANQTGVFVGITSHDYAQIQGDASQLDTYHITGNALNAAAGRLSYVFGFQGPCLAVDTACSSSLVAVHLACRSLASGECSMALAGGVNLILSSIASLALTRARVLSADGRCKGFDAAADGMGRGEGCGVIVLKRLADAMRDRDHIIAVIAGSAINQDGPSSGLTVPNGPAQELLIRRALAAGGLSPLDVDYIEAHGTGTALGDPVEFGALSAVFAPHRPVEHPLYLGSVKSNIGHSEAAAGIAGLIKAALAVHHGRIPPHLHFTRPNPHIRWAGIPITVPTSPTVWPPRGIKRTAGISSFGFTGTNAHVIVREAPAAPIDGAAGTHRPSHLLVFSARTKAALKTVAARCSDELNGRNNEFAADVCFSLSTGRAHFEHRGAACSASVERLAESLADFGRGLKTSILVGSCEKPPRVAWLFAAANRQPLAAVARLAESEPVFRRRLEECDAILRQRSQHSLFAWLSADHVSRLSHDQHRLALFALQDAYAHLWRSWGLVPAAVIAHGFGTMAAATAAEALALDDAVGLLIDRLDGTRSGRTTTGIRVHSLALRVLDRQGHVLSESSIAEHVGEALDRRTLDDDAEWRVGGYDVVLEMGPTSRSSNSDEHRLREIRSTGTAHEQVLESLAELYVRGADLDWRAFWRDRPARRVVLPTYPFDRQRYWIAETTTQNERPVRPMAQRDFHPLLGEEIRLAGTDERRFACRIRSDAPGFLQDHGVFDETVFPAAGYLELAIAAARTTDPSCAVELQDITFHRPLSLPPDVETSLQTVVTREGNVRRFQVFSSTAPRHGGSDQWLLHCSGVLALARDESPDPPQPPATVGLRALQSALTERVAPDDLYQQCQARGIRLGPQFRALAGVVRRDGEALGRVQLPSDVRSSARDFHFHPVLLDGCFQTLGAAGTAPGRETVYLPLALNSVRLLELPPESFWCHARIRPVNAPDSPHLVVDFTLFADDGRLIGEIEGLQLQRVKEISHGRFPAVRHDWLYEIGWEPRPDAVGSARHAEVVAPHGLESAANPAEPWVIFADARGVGQHLADELAARGASCVLVRARLRDEAQPGPGVFIDPGNPDDYHRVLEEVSGIARAPVRGIVHLWGLDASTAATPSSCRTQAGLQCRSFLHLVQAAARLDSPAPPRICLVTSGAQAAGREQLLGGVFQAPLWAMGKAVALEHAEFNCVRIDLDPDEPSLTKLACVVVQELWAADGEPEIAFRADQRLVSRLVRHSQVGSRPAPAARTDEDGLPVTTGGRREPAGPTGSGQVSFRADATYLITGGLTGLGRSVAQWMPEHGARHLALMSRREMTGTQRAELAALADRGVTVTHYRGDVGKLDDVERVIAEIAASPWPLRGIVHAAGILLDRSLTHASWDDFHSVWTPKIDGAWHLHSSTAGQPLDFFVLFSSAASMLGSAGQTNYCAANAFLDALAGYRAAQGLPAVSINWGPWSVIGAAANLEISARLARHGIGSMTPDQGLALLEYIMAGSIAQVGAIPIDWASLVDRYPQGTEPRFFSRIAAAEPARRVPAEPATTRPARRFPAQAPAAERTAWLRDYLSEQVGAALQLPQAQISLTKPLNQMGLDSLMAIEIRNRIKTDLSLDVPVVTFLDDASVESLASTLAEARRRAPSGDRPIAAASGATTSASDLYSLAPEISPDVATQLLSRLTELTADQVDALLSGVGPVPPGEQA